MFNNLLRCPNCKDDRADLEVVTSLAALRCGTCNALFEIRGGAPRFMSNSDIGFDQRWREHPAPQPTPVEQFVAKTGWDVSALRDKTVLDAGCGIGRYCRFAGKHGAARVVGVDISADGIAAAAKNTQEHAAQTMLVQANLLNIPIKSESIDLAYSIGVLHHTQHPVESFKEVARTVKRGGRMAVWVYVDPATDGQASTSLAIEFFHRITRACPPEALYNIIKEYAVRIRDMNHPAWGPLQQVIRPSYNPSDEQCISDMFDWHTPQYRFYHAINEVKQWFESSGFKPEWTGEFPVSVSGIKL